MIDLITFFWIIFIEIWGRGLLAAPIATKDSEGQADSSALESLCERIRSETLLNKEFHLCLQMQPFISLKRSKNKGDIDKNVDTY